MRKFPIVLVVDDSESFRVFFRDVLKRTVKFVRVLEAKDGLEGLKLYMQYKPDVILLDMKMPKLEGDRVLQAIHQDDANSRVVITSAYVGDQDSINRLMKLGAFSYLPKPMNRMVLMKTITDVLNDGRNADRKKKSKTYKNTIQKKRISNSFVLNQEF